jgi:Calcineurin-like phosphoesterase
MAALTPEGSCPEPDHALADAGLAPECRGWPPGTWTKLLSRREKGRNMNWAGPRALIESYNDLLAPGSPDIVNSRRSRWVAGQRAAGVERDFPDLVIDRGELDDLRFIVLGDPGDGDASQYACAPALLAEESHLMVILSDVIYPAGDVNHYVNGFYLPYAAYKPRIYAIPGNHDWYDGLNGFMYHFCRVEGLPQTVYSARGRSMRERIARVLWRRASRPERALLSRYQHEREPGPPRPVQPGPYWALDTPRLRLVAIDTGITGEIDKDQGLWLERVSKDPRPKVLLTGKPIYVNNTHQPCAITEHRRFAKEARTVDDIVRDPESHYVAAIGGDVHNYQRYPIRVPGGDGGERTIQYIVSGGGGAHLSATHLIPKVEVRRLGPDGRPSPEVEATEDAVKLFPWRGHSLARFSRHVADRIRGAVATLAIVAAAFAGFCFGLWFLGLGGQIAAGVLGAVGLVPALAAVYVLVTSWTLIWRGGEVDPDVASRYVADLIADEPARQAAQKLDVDPLTRRKLHALLPKAGRGRSFLHGAFFSPFFDFNEPPFLGHFLRLAVEGETLRITCHVVTGFAQHEKAPPVWDCVEIPLAPSAPG